MVGHNWLAKSIIRRQSTGNIRTLLIKNTAVGIDIADHVPVQADGTPVQVVGVLRKAISIDLTIVIKLNGATLITCNIPSATAIDTPVFFASFASSLAKNDILSAAITSSDGSQDPDGIASFTLEW